MLRMSKEKQTVAYSAVKALLNYGEKLKGNEKNAVGRDVDFVDAATHPEWAPANEFLLRYPFAFLLGVIYDQGQGAERAWRYPYQLYQALGNLDPSSIANMHLIDLDDLFLNTRPSLYYWRQASGRTLRAAQRVFRDYDGDASQIWLKGQPSPHEIQTSFKGFDGVGPEESVHGDQYPLP